MSTSREDFLPIYSIDLTEKSKRLRNVIENIISYNIKDISDITQEEYEIIKLGVINSIKGSAIAAEEKSRQNFVEETFLKPSQKRGALDYIDQSSTEKCDFIGTFSKGVTFGLEVKGGEGNSVTLLERPSDVDIFVVWSHLDVMSNTPYENMRSVLGRIVKQMVNRDDRRQHVNFLIFYDQWYENGLKRFPKGKSYPDVFVFPESIPTLENPHPEIYEYKDNLLLQTLYQCITGKSDINDPSISSHIWLCDIQLMKDGPQWKRRLIVKNSFKPTILFLKQGKTDAKIKVIEE